MSIRASLLRILVGIVLVLPAAASAETVSERDWKLRPLTPIAGGSIDFSNSPLTAAVREEQARPSGQAPPEGLILRAPQRLEANGLSLEGNLAYSYIYTGSSGTMNMTADRVHNTRTSGVSGTLQLQLWATTAQPVFGQTIFSYTLGVYTLGTLSAGQSFFNVNTGTISFFPPPPGTYYITMALMEYDGTQYVYQDFLTFSFLKTFGSAPPCVVNSTTLCLNNGRFKVQTFYQTSTSSGAGAAVGLTSDTGYFWFFSSNNVEAVVKVVNGCSFNNRYWVFAGGLTNQGVTFTITDTATGFVKYYTNALGLPFAPIQDTAAFATCP
jgi:hypothetical protein